MPNSVSPGTEGVNRSVFDGIMDYIWIKGPIYEFAQYLVTLALFHEFLGCGVSCGFHDAFNDSAFGYGNRLA